ncbi:acyltransferase family protein [Maritalea porphyrae]|uniref:Acyltransferase 3 domain-containing protein n=1 Tax=Maritalea porphyrae TaxID=880732 RepID=A0ABQ5ULW4_9HYPH|nr:acyltransferase [Maritalea porphyrae]GLQ16107.1 hypothetical protein GCM10007879_03560 [Maritalea porphyrae]
MANFAKPIAHKTLNNAEKPQNRDQTLDIFRAAAVLMVVLFHYTTRLPSEVFGAVPYAVVPFEFGWIGVYFFFIISGFCIFFTLEKAKSIGSFLAKRFSRIYPAFLAAAVLLFALDQVFGLPLLPEFSYRETAPSIVDLVGNLVLLGGIFEWVNGSFWSITVEVQFYVMIAIMALVFKQGEKLARLFSYAALALGTAWLLVELASSDIATMGKLATMLQKTLIAPFMPFFAVGVVGVQLKRSPEAFAGLFWQLAALCFVIVVVTSAEGDATLLSASSVSTGLIVVGLIGIFCAYCVGWRLPHMPFLSNGLAHIGLLSFSWYLLHENLGFLLLEALNPALPYWLSVIIAMGMTYAAAAMFSKLFEWRFRKTAEAWFMAALRLFTARLPKKMGESLI